MEKIIKKIFIILFLSSLLFSFGGPSLAATATLYGEVNDDGGDPDLYVWFEYGKTTSYGYTTPQQTKYGTGEFSATVTNLEDCTTYHYRAIAKHQNYDDTKYGEDKTFTTPCPSSPSPTVDLKVNGSDGPITIPYNSFINLSWTSSNSNYCIASNAWSGTKGTSGSETIYNLISSKTYTLTCYGAGGSAVDSVQVNVSGVLATVSPSVSKKARNISNGQTVFSNYVTAEPGDVLEFQIIVNAGSGAKNAIIKDILPDKILIRAGSLKINGVSASGDIISGISLGDLSENEVRTIVFLTDIAGIDNFPQDTTHLTNTAQLSFEGGSVNYFSTLIIQKPQLKKPTTVSTGFDKKLISRALIFTPLLLSPFFLLFSSHLEINDWFLTEKIKLKEFFSRKFLERKISQLRK